MRHHRLRMRRNTAIRRVHHRPRAGEKGLSTTENGPDEHMQCTGEGTRSRRIVNVFVVLYRTWQLAAACSSRTADRRHCENVEMRKDLEMKGRIAVQTHGQLGAGPKPKPSVAHALRRRGATSNPVDRVDLCIEKFDIVVRFGTKRLTGDCVDQVVSQLLR